MEGFATHSEAGSGSAGHAMGPYPLRMGSAELARAPTDTDSLGVMLTSMADFRAPGDARAEAARCLRALLETGKAPRDHVVQVLGRG